MGINAVTTKLSKGRPPWADAPETRSVAPPPQPGLPGPSVLQALPRPEEQQPCLCGLQGAWDRQGGG